MNVNYHTHVMMGFFRERVRENPGPSLIVLLAQILGFLLPPELDFVFSFVRFNSALSFFDNRPVRVSFWQLLS